MSTTLYLCWMLLHYEEVKFRWVDRYLIHLTISEKFHIAFWFPLFIIAFLSWYLLAASHQQEISLRLAQLQQRVETTAQLVSQQPTLVLPADLRLTRQGSSGLQQQGIATCSAHQRVRRATSMVNSIRASSPCGRGRARP